MNFWGQTFCPGLNVNSEQYLWLCNMYWQKIFDKPGRRSLTLGPVEESCSLGMHVCYLPSNRPPEIVLP